MLKTHQKALILERAGVAIPHHPGQLRDAFDEEADVATAIHRKDDA